MIVGIAGLKSARKSLLGEMLVERHGFRVVSLAAPIKRIVGELFGFTDQQLYGPSWAREEPHPTLKRPDGQPLTARYALQTLGTDWARQCCDEVWIAAMFAGVKPGEDVVCCDLRFKNELDAFRKRGAFVIKRRPCVAPTPAEIDAMHISERELYEEPDSSFDAVLGYYHDKRHLQNAVDVLVSGWRDRSEVA